MSWFCKHDWFYGEYSDRKLFSDEEVIVQYKECSECGKRVIINKF